MYTQNNNSGAFPSTYLSGKLTYKNTVLVITSVFIILYNCCWNHFSFLYGVLYAVGAATAAMNIAVNTPLQQ
jgi:hypothetical protein